MSSTDKTAADTASGKGSSKGTTKGDLSIAYNTVLLNLGKLGNGQLLSLEGAIRGTLFSRGMASLGETSRVSVTTPMSAPRPTTAPGSKRTYAAVAASSSTVDKDISPAEKEAIDAALAASMSSAEAGPSKVSKPKPKKGTISSLGKISRKQHELAEKRNKELIKKLKAAREQGGPLVSDELILARLAEKKNEARKRQRSTRKEKAKANPDSMETGEAPAPPPPPCSYVFKTKEEHLAYTANSREIAQCKAALGAMADEVRSALKPDDPAVNLGPRALLDALLEAPNASEVSKEQVTLMRTLLNTAETQRGLLRAQGTKVLVKPRPKPVAKPPPPPSKKKGEASGTSQITSSLAEILNKSQKNS